jgi:hypothetical protein
MLAEASEWGKAVEAPSLCRRFSSPEMVVDLQVGECTSVLSAGVALDNLGVTIRQLCLVLAFLGGLMTVGWLPYYLACYKSSSAAKPSSEV